MQEYVGSCLKGFHLDRAPVVGRNSDDRPVLLNAFPYLPDQCVGGWTGVSPVHQYDYIGFALPYRRIQPLQCHIAGSEALSGHSEPEQERAGVFELFGISIDDKSLKVPETFLQ